MFPRRVSNEERINKRTGEIRRISELGGRIGNSKRTGISLLPVTASFLSRK